MKIFIFVSVLLLIDSSASLPTNESTTPVATESTTSKDKSNSSVSEVHFRADDGPAGKNTTKDDDDEIDDVGWEYENTTIVDTRRILYSKRVPPGKRPYMVYLQLTKDSAKAHKYRGWLCGGVIVDASYVLTSAACVEDAEHFYIVSGTTKFVDSFDYKSDDCVCKHRRKVVWKCIPKNYKFDFQDSIKWSSNDIAVVKVNKPFKLGVKESGCEFAPELICYNNISRELEKPGTKGYIAGWGSGSSFREGVYRRDDRKPENAKCLQEAKVCVMDNEQCAKKWAQKFRSIITQYMICTKDVMKKISEVCDKKYANCTEVSRRKEMEEVDKDDNNADSNTISVDLGRHIKDPDDYTARRSSQGGFCENDHGGPLIVKYKGIERALGVISACKIDAQSHSCHGPFLYTSIFKNRQFISCAIQKDVQENCRRVFRSGITHEEYTVDWDNVREDDEEKSDGDSDGDDAKLRSEKTAKESKDSESSEEKKEKTEKKSKHEKKTEKKDKKKHKHEGVKTGNGDEVIYESSKEDNVNEPVED